MRKVKKNKLCAAFVVLARQKPFAVIPRLYFAPPKMRGKRRVKNRARFLVGKDFVGANDFLKMLGGRLVARNVRVIFFYLLAVSAAYFAKGRAGP